MSRLSCGLHPFFWLVWTCYSQMSGSNQRETIVSIALSGAGLKECPFHVISHILMKHCSMQVNRIGGKKLLKKTPLAGTLCPICLQTVRDHHHTFTIHSVWGFVSKGLAVTLPRLWYTVQHTMESNQPLYYTNIKIRMIFEPSLAVFR